MDRKSSRYREHGNIPVEAPESQTLPGREITLAIVHLVRLKGIVGDYIPFVA